MAVESSFYLINVISGTMRLVICGIIFAAVLVIHIRKYINFKILLTAFFLIAWAFLFDSIIAMSVVKQTYIIIIHILTGFTVSLYIKKGDFIDKYLNIIYFLALFSLVTFILNLIAPQITYSFPVILSRNKYTYYNLLFSVVTNNGYVARNYGLFWEPGAFAFFLCIALYLELIVKDNIRIPRILFLSATIFSTKSTMGIIAVVLIYVIYYINNPFKISARAKWLLLFLLIAIIASVFILPKSFWGDIFDKLFVEDNSGKTNSSTQTRYDAIYYMLKEFFNSITIGVGIEKFIILQEEYSNNMATATMINWLVIYGMVWGAVNVLGYFKFFLTKKTSVVSVAVILVFCSLIVATENFLLNPFIYALIGYGFGGERN
ncbi:MAG: hypothetical protein ACLR56_08095 [Oscillospiraceae bacterium]